MANRRNLRRYRGLAEPIHGSTMDSSAARPDDELTLEEVAAAALHDESCSSVARPEKVARAKMLLADPDYPPKEVIQSVAGLLAEHFGTPEPR